MVGLKAVRVQASARVPATRLEGRRCRGATLRELAATRLLTSWVVAVEQRTPACRAVGGEADDGVVEEGDARGAGEVHAAGGGAAGAAGAVAVEEGVADDEAAVGELEAAALVGVEGAAADGDVAVAGLDTLAGVAGEGGFEQGDAAAVGGVGDAGEGVAPRLARVDGRDGEVLQLEGGVGADG
ncbi:MAG: hypothetical protein IPG96_08775 [Proteobacteria bacterium]|nr:hypothetical protein [Pseudomonadota bacterium]